MRRHIGKGIVLRLIALLAAAMMLSGCITMAVESDFNEDGSGTHSLAVTMDTAILSQLGDLTEEDEDPFEDFEEIEREAAELGYRVERIEDGDVIGVRLISDVEDSSNLGQILNDLFNASNTEGDVVAPFSGTFEKDGNDFRLNLTVDGNVLSQGAGEGLGEDPDDLAMFGGLEAIFEFTYAVRLPGEIDTGETNGRVGSDGRVTWNLPLQGTENLTAVSRGEGGSSNLLLILVILGIVFFGLIALAAVAFFIIRGRQGPQFAPASGPATEPPPGSAPSSEQPTQPMGTPPPPAPPGSQDGEHRSEST